MPRRHDPGPPGLFDLLGPDPPGAPGPGPDPVPEPELDPEPGPEKPGLQEAFEAFHAAHPDVFTLFRRFARELKDGGRDSYGAKSIMERIRWHYATTSRGETFKINNNFTSRYARLLVAEEPAFAGFFETRRLATEKGAGPA